MYSELIATTWRLEQVINENHSRFASVMTIDNVLKLLREDDVI